MAGRDQAAEALELLRRARALVEKPRMWTRGAYARDRQGNAVPPRLDAGAKRFCASGALLCAEWEDGTWLEREPGLYFENPWGHIEGPARLLVGLDLHAFACPRFSVPARLSGRAVCLRDGQRCRAKYERQYQRYGFHCRSGSLVATWRRLERAIHIPRLDAGSTCPVTPLASNIDFRSHGVGRGIGDGPVYPVPFSTDPTQPINDYVVPSDWHGGKHAFLTLSGYRGPVLIRGRQLDGTGIVTFASNDIPGAPSLAAPKPDLRVRAGLERVVRTFYFVAPPACYAYQIDGTTFSKIVVFRVSLSG